MAGISKKKVKTKKGTEVKYTITYRDIFGKQHTSGLYDTQKEAKKHLAKFENINPDNQNITYEAIFNNFLQKAKKKYADNTIENYERYYKVYFAKIKNIKYDKIDSITWQSFFDDIEKHSPHIAQVCLKFAKAAVNYNIKHGLIEYNIFNKIEKIQIPKPDINHLTIEELKAVLNECEKTRKEYYPLLFTFIGTGAREGEIFALAKEDFNYKEKTIIINKQFTRGKLKPKPKTASSNRKIYLFDELVEVINEHIKSLDPANPLLFPNQAGNYHNPSNFRERIFYPLLKSCNIEKRVRLHDLRGSYTDMTLANGLSIKFTQNNLGHSRSETTTNIYARNNEDMIAKAQLVLNNVFSKKYENFVRIKQETPNKKIIQFPKRSLDTAF